MFVELADEATLVATVQAGLIPAEVLNAPVRIVRNSDSIRLEPAGRLSPTAQRKLTAAGLVVSRGSLPAGDKLSTWAEAVRCRRRVDAGLSTDGASDGPPLGEVLFVLGPEEPVMPLCAELLRLGCPTQQIAGFADSDQRPLTMVRVTAPPYYVVLRALDETERLRAFSARTDGVWMQLGWEHPFEPARPGPNQLLLIPAVGRWLVAPDGPWSSLERHLHIVLPAENSLSLRTLDAHLKVPLRLEPSSRSNPARLWVLENNGIEQIERLLGTLPSPVVDQIHFAVLDEAPNAGSRSSTELFVLRSPELGESPPALDLDAAAFASRNDLPNLYLPVGTTLAPPLTSEQLRLRLAPDPDELVWVERKPHLVTRRVRESAFGPLSDWADYVIDQAAEPLGAWMAGALFEFEQYRVEAPAAATEPPKTARSRSREPVAPASLVAPSRPPVAQRVLQKMVTSLPKAWTGSAPQIDETAALVTEIERRLIDVPRDETTEADWREYGRALARAGRPREAGLAYARGAWSSTEPQVIYDEWAEVCPLRDELEAELQSASLTHGGEAPLDDVARLAAHVLAAQERHDKLDQLAAQRWLSMHESRLSVHVGWLIRVALAEAAGGDPLGLLRTRDNITSRIEDGLALARDVPSYVRQMGAGDATAPLDFLRERLDQIWARYGKTDRERSWNEAPEQLTRSYVGLLIRWGHARLGDRQMRDELKPNVDASDPGHDAILRLFDARIAQALEGAEPSALVPAIHAERIRQLPSFLRFKVERLWHGSQVLGGASAQDPFRRWADRTRTPPLPADMAARAGHLEALWSTDVDENRAREAIALLSGLPESEAIPMFPRTIQWMANLPESDRSEPLEAMIFLAGHLDRSELVEQTLPHLTGALDQSAMTAARVYGRIARILTRAGLSDRIRGHVGELVEQLDEQGIAQAQARLSLATALAALGDHEAAPAAIERTMPMLGASLRPDERLGLVRHLCLALSRTSAARAAQGVEALMPRLAQVTDKFSTNSHFCLSVVHFMESMVLALTGRDLTVGPKARRWLDADETELRERIHQDLKRLNS